MKKFLITLLSICLIFGIAVTCGCGDTTASSKKLSYGKKYYSSNCIGDDANGTYYYVFNKGGTGVYANHYSSTPTVEWGYEIAFDYKIVDGKAVCTYNSEINSFSDQHCDSDWYEVWEFSEDFLFRQGMYGTTVYFCEDYLKTVPNFGK